MKQNVFPEDWERKINTAVMKKDGCRKRAYICSPLNAPHENEILENIRNAKAYAYYADSEMNLLARAPHAFIPHLLCDNIPSERALALQFGLKLLEMCDVLLVCGTRVSRGMESEIVTAASLKMPIVVYDKDTYLTVRKLATRAGADRRLVSFDGHHPLMGLAAPVEDASKAVI